MTRDRDADEPQDWLAAKFHNSDAGASRSEPEEEPADASAFRWGLTPSVLETDADQTDADQTDADQADANQTDADQADANQTDADHTDADELDADQTDADELDADQTDAAEPGAHGPDAQEAGPREPDAREADAREADAREADAREAGIDGDASSDGDPRTTAAVASDTTDSDDLDIGDVEPDATPATFRSIFAPRSARVADGQGDAAPGSAPLSAPEPIDPGEASAAAPLDVTVRPFYPPPPAISRNIALPRPVSTPRFETSAPVDSATTGGRAADEQTTGGRAADEQTTGGRAAADSTADAATNLDDTPPMTMDEVLDAPSPRRAAREAAAREAVAREAAVRDASSSAPGSSRGTSGDGIPAAAQARSADVDAESADGPADRPTERPVSSFGSSSPVPLVEPALAPMSGTADIDALLGSVAAAGAASSPADDVESAPGPRRRGPDAPAAPELPFENLGADDREFVQPALRAGRPSMSTLQKTLLGVGLVLIVVLLIVLVIVIVQRAGTTGALPGEATTVAALAGYLGSLRG